MAQRRLRRDDYTVGWICALPIELAAAQELLDEEHEDVEHDENDHNLYSLGRMADQNIVIVCLPAGLIGNNPAAAVATQMKATFKSVRFGLMVGIGGGVPSTDSDIRLGDVVISQPQKGYGGVIQYDFVKTVPSGFQRTGFINCPPLMLLSAIAKMRASHLRQRSKLAEYASKLSHLQEFNREAAGPDILYEATYEHEGGSTCSSCRTDKRVDRPRRRAEETIVHYGIIASGNQVMRHATERDTVSAEFGGVLCFEMEAAGLMNSFPCLIIRGICDYSDSHKNKRWQAYAAGVSAACAKEVLSIIPPADIAKTSPLEDIFGKDSRGQIEQDYKDAHIREGESASLQDTYCIETLEPEIQYNEVRVPFRTRTAPDIGEMSTPSRRKWPRKPIELRHESNGASSLSRSISPKGNFGFLIRNGWTELDKDLVSSRALDSVNEDYEDIGHAFLISRPLSRSEIQDYLERSISRNPKGIMPTYGRNINQFFNIPLRDNPYFTGRQRHLSRLDEILYPLSKSVTSHLRCAVLVGLGGGGKTEIAARYAHLHRNEYLAVLWIDGTSRGSLASSFSGLRNGLSRQMTIPGHQSSRSGSSESTSRSRTRNSSVNLVADYESMITSQMLASGESLSKTIHWLNSTHHRYHWLMIIDNLDDPDMVETIEDILVQLDRGCVIITSRNSGAAGLGTAVDVGELTSAEASEFLFRSLQLEDQTKAHSHQESVNSLCELLGYLALAIDQAVAYINENHLTIDEYIEIFQQQKADLLGRSSHNRYQRTRSSDLDGKYNTALTTWEISFRFVQHNSPAAALLLHLLAFMNNNDISEDIFRVIYDTKRRWDVWTTTGAISTFNDWENGVARALIQGMNSKPKFHEIVGKLLAFSLVKRTASRRRISIHPLVHFWASARMEPWEQRQWMNLTAEFLTGNIPVRYQLPLIEPLRDAMIPMIVPHIHTIYEHSKTLAPTIESRVVRDLISFGAYHSQQPSSCQMFAYCRTVTDISCEQEFLVPISWELSHSCHLGHVSLADDRHSSRGKDIQVRRNTSLWKEASPKDLIQEQAHYSAAMLLQRMLLRSRENKSLALCPAERAAMVRLAVVLALHYEHGEVKPDIREMNDESILDVLRIIITKWTPSAECTDMETETEAFQNFYICAIAPHDYTIQEEVASLGLRIIKSFEEFASVRKLCHILSDRLTKYAKFCNTDAATKVITKILQQDQPVDSVLSIWNDLAPAISETCRNSETKTDGQKILGLFQLFRDRELLLQRTQIAIKSVKRAAEQWRELLEKIERLMPIRDDKGQKAITDFLKHPPASELRDDALLALGDYTDEINLTRLTIGEIIRGFRYRRN